MAGLVPASYSPAPEAQRHGQGPFATPTLDSGVLYAFGINEVLSAYDAASGKLLWRHDFGKEFSTPRPYYGTSASPLVADGMVVVQAGGEGKGAVVALDAKTGQPRWRLDGDGPGYGSPVVASFGGVRQVIVPTQNKIRGAALATGEKLWEMPFKVPYDQNILTPVVAGDLGDIFIMSGEDTDTQAIRVSRKDGAWGTEKVWANRSITMYMSSPVLADGLLCGFSSFRRGHVFCADAKTGEVRWKTEGGEGESAAVVAGHLFGNHLFVLRNDAELHVFQRTGGELKKVAQYAVADAASYLGPPRPAGRPHPADGQGCGAPDIVEPGVGRPPGSPLRSSRRSSSHQGRQPQRAEEPWRRMSARISRGEILALRPRPEGRSPLR